jgi:ABC-2 type transport system permease protein
MKSRETLWFTWRPLLALTWREWIRFYRQPSRLIGALGTPLVFWFLIGSGLGKSFHSAGSPGRDYLEYFYPGTIAMILLFTSIFSTISLIEDRKEGFLQSVLVAPVSRFGLVGGKILGGTILSFSQGVFFLLLAPLVGYHPNLPGLALCLLTMLILSFSLTSLGFIFAWRLNSIQGFHSVMNLLLFPMWFLSGALFPASGAPAWLRFLMSINPMTYGVSLLQRGIVGTEAGVATTSPSLELSLWVSVIFGILFYLGASFVVRAKPKEGLA